MASRKLGTFKSVKVKPISYTTKWIKNATRSIGLTTTEVLKTLAPNVSDAATSVADVSRDVVSTIRTNRNANKRITDVINSNRYVQLLNTTFKNVKSDLKTGMLYNDKRGLGSTNDFEDFKKDVESGSSFSFDDSASDEGNQINYINQSSNDASLNALSSQIANAATANVKMQKASMDAYISISAANMQQSGKIGADILTQLSNINNNLSALVQYNNDNMTKYIEAALAYYDKAGANIDGTNGNKNNFNNSDDENKVIKPSDLLNNNGGGIKLSSYKKFLKQNIKTTIENSDAGFIKTLIDSPMLDEFVANPIGNMGKIIALNIMPNIVQNSIKGIEDSFSNMSTIMLREIGKLSNKQGSGLGDIFLRNFGKIFGIVDDPNEQRTNIGKAQLNRGAIPFDGETKYAITTLIPQELKLQTAYLKILANNTKGKKPASAVTPDQDKITWFSYKNNKEMTKEDINLDIASAIMNEVRSSMNKSKFGESLSQLVTNQYKIYGEEEKEKGAAAA